MSNDVGNKNDKSPKQGDNNGNLSGQKPGIIETLSRIFANKIIDPELRSGLIEKVAAKIFADRLLNNKAQDSSQITKMMSDEEDHNDAIGIINQMTEEERDELEDAINNEEALHAEREKIAQSLQRDFNGKTGNSYQNAMLSERLRTNKSSSMHKGG